MYLSDTLNYDAIFHSSMEEEEELLLLLCSALPYHAMRRTILSVHFLYIKIDKVMLLKTHFPFFVFFFLNKNNVSKENTV